MTLRRIALLAAVALTVGCSDKGKIKEPAELQAIDRPQLQTDNFWRASAGDGSADLQTGLHLAVRDDAVFAADVHGRVYAFDLLSGKHLWRSETAARLAGGPGVSGELVTVGSRDAEVIALQRRDGVERWRVQLPSEILAAPVPDGDTVIARTVDGRVFALAAADGARLWSFERTVPPLTLRGLSQPRVAAGVVYAGMDSGRLAALDLRSGQVLWEQVVSAPAGRSELERLSDIDAEILLDPTRPDVLYAASYGGDVVALERATGAILWRTALRSYTGLSAAGGRLAITDEDGLVHMLDAQTGAVLWKQEALRYRKLSAPAIQTGAVVVADFEGYLHWLSATDGSLIARDHAVDEPVRAPLVARERIVFVFAADGEIVAVEARPKT